MVGFIQITEKLLTTNTKLAKYLQRADIKPAKKGGAFVGNHDVAPDEFRTYGIVLPRGGMIIPDANPDELKEIVYGHERRREEENTRIRRATEESYLNDVTRILTKKGVLSRFMSLAPNWMKDMLPKSDISDIRILVKDGKKSDGVCRSVNCRDIFLVREDEPIFGLYSSHESFKDYDNATYRPWMVAKFTPIREVVRFLKAERALVGPRKLFAERIDRLIEMSAVVGGKEGLYAYLTLGKVEEISVHYRVKLVLFDDYSKGSAWLPFCKSVFSAHRVLYQNELYEMKEEDIARLEDKVTEWWKKAMDRQKKLKELFFESFGVFSCTIEPFMDNDGYRNSRRRYFLGKEELEGKEMVWLNSFLPEIKVPEGYVRVLNDTHTLLRVPEIPGRDDVLVVWGRRGKMDECVELFRGHPSGCPEEFFIGRSNQARIKKVFLNERQQLVNWINLAPWKNPSKNVRELAVRAVEEMGVGYSSEDHLPYVKALMEEYRLQLEKK